MKQRLRSIYVFQWVSFIFLACVFWVLRHECIRADATDQICLASATPALNFINTIMGGGFFPWSLEGYYTYAFYGSLILLGLIFAALIGTRRCSWWTSGYLLALIACVYGELMSVQLKPLAFGVWFCAGLILAGIAFYLQTRNDGSRLSTAWMDTDARRVDPRWYEIGILALLLIAIAAARFYAVNEIPGHWDTEMCGHRPVVASWELMIQQELGNFSQQASGLSWLLAHRFFSGYEDAFSFFLDQRILGAGISLLNCWIVYFLLRSLAGPFAALAGLIMFGFGPVEIEWARGATLHHLPIFIGLLLVWWSCKAFHERTWRAFIIVALLIPITKYFYPSARLIALGPCLGFVGALLWHRQEWRGHTLKLFLIPLGGLLYMFSRSILSWYTTGTFRWIFPFEQIQPINGEGGVLNTLVSMAKVVPDLLRETFSIPRIFDHYTGFTTVYPPHVLPSLGVIFGGIALIRLLCSVRHPLALTWIGVLIGGVVPTLMTGLSERRFAVTIIAISLLATLELTWFLNHLLAPRIPKIVPALKTGVVGLSATCLCVFQTSVMFSRPANRPHQLYMIEAVRPLITPGTFVVHMETGNPCSFFYGIYDILRQSEGRIGYLYCLDLPGGPKEAMMTPRITVDTWQYRHTALASQASIVKSRQDWSRVLFVFYAHPSTVPWQQTLKERYPNGFGREILIPNLRNDATGVYVFEAPYEP